MGSAVRNREVDLSPAMVDGCGAGLGWAQSSACSCLPHSGIITVQDNSYLSLGSHAFAFSVQVYLWNLDDTYSLLFILIVLQGRLHAKYHLGCLEKRGKPVTKNWNLAVNPQLPFKGRILVVPTSGSLEDHRKSLHRMQTLWCSAHWALSDKAWGSLLHEE